MTFFLARTAGFFSDNVPSWRLLLLGGPPALAWAWAALWFAGGLRQRGVRTGYTRKVFHFLIFGTVAALQGLWGTPAVCLFGGMSSLVIFFAVWQGPGHRLYEAMAREKDAPHRTYYIVAPYFATLIGGLFSNILFGPLAVVGYLVAGLGDAVGEPVGTRFGRHTYRVPSFGGVRSSRSWEGSAAVFAASLLALLLAAHGAGRSPAWLPLVALASAAVEAVSPHGWDNATMQVVPTALVWLWMT